MGKIYKKIKARNGESFAKTIRNYDSGILEIPDIEKILYHAGNKKEDAESLLQYLIGLKGIKIKEETKIESPFDLLKKAGYDAFHADTLEKQNSIAHLYRTDEKICTFNDKERFQNYFIIHAIHENALLLKRDDFKNPEREDPYGTSVISIQLSKRGGFISIKNRYNHNVRNCDNTFNSNPDNIIQGLAAALKEYFKVDFSSRTANLSADMVLVGNQIIKQLQEVGGIIFSNDCYVKNGEIINVDRGKGLLLMNYFVYDDKEKSWAKIPDITDSFADDMNKYYGGRKSLHLKGNSLYDGDLEIIRCE